MPLAPSNRGVTFDRLVNGIGRGLILAGLKLPYEQRLSFFDALVSRVVAPVAGYRKRVVQNLQLVMPELSDEEIARIYRGVCGNIGRTLIETYSYDDVVRTCSTLPLSGAGWDALEACRTSGRPVILATGHFGNYSAVRVALKARGYSIGAVYRPFSNRYFDAHYRAALDVFGPTFARGSKGTAQMVRHLKAGNQVAIVTDQHFSSGATLEFFGRPVKSAISAASLALKYDALLVPVYGVRRRDGVGFDLVVQPPIDAGTPESMTQALNDSLEKMIRKYPDQWLWTHRRWK